MSSQTAPADPERHALTVLEVRGLSKRFGPRNALDSIDISAGRGEILAFLGPNGAGKTTLLKVVATLLAPSSGSVAVEGHDVVEDAEEVRRRIGCAFHDVMLYENLTVEENLRFFGRLYGAPPSGERLDALLAALGLQHRRTDRVSTLSRGMKQRTALARAMLNGPRLLLLDEPFTGLDEVAGEALKSFLRDFAASSGPVLLTTHDPRLAYELASRLVVLVRGRIAREVRPEGTSIDGFAQEYRRLLGG